jgi:hypothetical protein
MLGIRRDEGVVVGYVGGWLGATKPGSFASLRMTVS